MKLSQFGYELRKIRLERQLRSKDIADAVGYTPAFMSAVESGNREVPLMLPHEIAHALGFTEAELERLELASDNERKSTTIKMPDSVQDRYLIGAFARNIGSLDAETKEAIHKIISSRGGNHHN